MKFAHQYQQRLGADGYPPDWIQAAVSYSKLKKCVNRVQRELSALGLDVKTLRDLLVAVEKKHADQQLLGDDTNKKPFRYRFSEKDAPSIRPELLFVVDEETGEPLDARLAPSTRAYLHQLAISEQLTTVRIVDEEGCSIDLTEDNSTTEDRRDSPPRKLVRVPLSSDSEFFSILEKDLCNLADLQVAQKKKMSDEIKAVGITLSRATNPERSSKSKHDLTQWRRLFELYTESNVFFATNEQDHGVHNSVEAQTRLTHFLDSAKKNKLLDGFKTLESRAALQKFIAINTELLQFVRFREINHLAMTKILKKFDKRTALGAKGTFLTYLPASLLSQDLSQALSAEVSNQILSTVPRLDDYLCPICFSIAYRPVRLKCGHLFCIRCLIVMQREEQKRCALCREEVVMEADSTNLDPSVANFLVTYFAHEVKQKQKANEQAIAVDQYGEWGNTRCCIM